MIQPKWHMCPLSQHEMWKNQSPSRSVGRQTQLGTSLNARYLVLLCLGTGMRRGQGDDGRASSNDDGKVGSAMTLLEESACMLSEKELANASVAVKSLISPLNEQRYWTPFRGTFISATLQLSITLSRRHAAIKWILWLRHYNVPKEKTKMSIMLHEFHLWSGCFQHAIKLNFTIWCISCYWAGKDISVEALLCNSSCVR